MWYIYFLACFTSVYVAYCAGKKKGHAEKEPRIQYLLECYLKQNEYYEDQLRRAKRALREWRLKTQ
jgi:hypothetical protein